MWRPARFEPRTARVVAAGRATRWLLGLASAVLVALSLAAAPPARTSADSVAASDLQTLDTSVGYAIRLEVSALNLAQHGNVAGARQELENSRRLLQGAFGAADALTPPRDLAKFAPPNGWDELGRNIRRADQEDEEALATPDKVRSTFVMFALNTKDAIHNLVHPNVKDPECSVVFNDVGPVKVNGVPQGSGQLSVDASCVAAIKKIIVTTPANTVAQVVPDAGTKAAALASASTVQVVVVGDRGGVTEKLSPDPAPGLPVDVMVILENAKHAVFDYVAGKM